MQIQQTDTKNSPPRSLVLFIIPILLILAPSVLFAAEVYYLGGGASESSVGEKSPAFSLKERVEDLCDFSSYGKYGVERSGRITGNIMEEMNWNDVGGNGSKSFLRKGVYQNTEVNVNLQEKLWQDYSFDGQVFVRKTDDRRIERRKDVRVKQLTTKIYNPSNMLLFGDFYGDFSQFTLSNSLEGFNLNLGSTGVCTLKGIAARSQSPDPDLGTFQRYVSGGKADFNLFQDSEIFSLFRTGIQAVTNQDDSATVDNTNRATPIQDINNTVVSVDGEVTFRKIFSLIYEAARSVHAADDKNPPNNDFNYGTAFRLQPGISAGPLILKYLYYYVQPKFYTDSGSAMADKIQHQLSLNYALTKKAVISFVENFYWNHLKESSLPKRTYNDEKYITLTLRPSDKHKEFSIRTYANILQADSDDIGNTSEATTITTGFGINDMLDSQTNYGIFMEFRGFVNEAAKSNSDYYYRLGGNIGREGQLLGKRLYISGDMNIDFHDPKSEPKEQVTTGCSFSGQYNFMNDHIFRFGYNIQTTNGSQSIQNFFNNRTYAEFDLLMEKRRNTHCIVRGEHNRYNQNDRGMSYDESRIVTRLASNF